MDENRSPFYPEEEPQNPYFTTPPADYLTQESVPDEYPEQYSGYDMPPLYEEEVYAEDVQPMYVPEEAAPVQSRRPKRRKKSAWRIVLSILALIGKWLLAAVLLVAVLAAGLIGYLTVTEYDPAYSEVAQRGGNRVSLSFPPENKQSTEVGATTAPPEMELRIVTFNTGYAGLDDDADFFMDGGSQVNPESAEQVNKNMAGIEQLLAEQEADILLLQEVDTDSDRSFHINQFLRYEHALEDYAGRFALNYSCDYVPYPLSERIGEVHSGIATYSRYEVDSATRYSLPCPFSWPIRVANLKRCLLVTRIPIENSTKEIVIVNLHLEAYDDGEGKAAQTEQLMNFLQEEYIKGNYVIAGGDFNQAFPDTLDSYPINDESEWMPGLLEDLPDDWRYVFDDSSPTCRLLNQPYDPSDSATQYYVIDGFIVSPNITVKRVKTVNAGFEYSDHNPVVIDITLQ